MTLNYVIRIALLLVACCATPGGMAQQAGRFEELSKLDLAFMAQQRSLLQDKAAISLGRQFTGSRDQDLDLLQTLLDKGLVRQDQTRELQAMGVIMGDLLAAEFGLHWVVYEDAVGRSRALRYRDSEFVVFPVTMISRRQEVGNSTPVADIYQKASSIIVANTPALPFQ